MFENHLKCLLNYTLVDGISNNDPSSSKEILLYSLLADNKLCSITALSSILEPENKEMMSKYLIVSFIQLVVKHA